LPDEAKDYIPIELNKRVDVSSKYRFVKKRLEDIRNHLNDLYEKIDDTPVPDPIKHAISFLENDILSLLVMTSNKSNAEEFSWRAELALKEDETFKNVLELIPSSIQRLEEQINVEESQA